MSISTATASAAAFMCDAPGCPALRVHEVEVHEQDFKFCNHHLNKYEAALLVAMEISDPELVGSVS